MSMQALVGRFSFSPSNVRPEKTLLRRGKTPPLVLHWVFGHLRKRGSFEDYLVAAAREAAKAGFRVHVAARLVINPDVRSALEQHKVRVHCATDDELNSASFFIRKIMQLRPTLLHCHFGSPSTSFALIAKLLGVRLFVVTDHGSRRALDNASALSARNMRRRILSRFVDLYLPVSGFVGKQLRREVGAARRKVATLFNGVDLDRFRPLTNPQERARRRAQLLGLSPKQRCILYVGQFTEAKGVGDILAIQNELLRLYGDVAFAWIGDGPLAPEIEARVNTRVRCLGLRNDVDALLPLADLIVAPSRWHEAFCLTVAEAAAAGVPAIATRVGGVPEVVLHGETGLLVPPGDRDALLGAIMKLLGDEPVRRAMGVAARKRAEQSFDLTEIVRSTMRHYGALGMPGLAPMTATKA